ncbi:2627_t:CDS:2 [Acaulospora colombiana]|uniref:2627_t:CDS:1 n=1 Tax=Acaulospora colombiana TaxID=27376 RepID=A0ACA9M1X8_9GLOM|nr:2627_t:CDS:2 [Acaulospora colombiana]
MFSTTLEHNEIAYGQNIRGFDAFVPDAFGSNPAQMERFYNEIYVHPPNPRIPVSPATLAGAAAYKAVRLHDSHPNFPQKSHTYEISKIREIAAYEALHLLQMFPLPNVDPQIVVVSAEAAAHRLYDHEHF